MYLKDRGVKMTVFRLRMNQGLMSDKYGFFLEQWLMQGNFLDQSKDNNMELGMSIVGFLSKLS